MNVLKDKTVVVGICGGIAAYKAAGVVSALVQSDARVEVIMTEAARKLITPITFQSLTHRPVYTDLWTEPLAHVELAREADIFVIMPATLNTISKVASGIADNLLTSSIPATEAPILYCPSMDANMYENRIFQDNMRKLQNDGNMHFIEPSTGRLASGMEGKGRFPEKEEILSTISGILDDSDRLEGVRVLVTAGPTREMIDPVRCITNRSSGKMGYEIAKAAKMLGAEKVCLVSGPTQLPPPTGIKLIRVESAREMRDKAIEVSNDFHWFILAAAVSDWRPREHRSAKMKKEGKEGMQIRLVKNPDIAEELGKAKKKDQLLVGFAAETDNLIENAQTKLKKKNMDYIVANKIDSKEAGFEVDTNKVTLIYRDGRIEDIPLMSKSKLARELLVRIVGS